MSPLTRWLGSGALMLIAVIAACACAYWRRYRTVLPPRARLAFAGRRLPRAEVASSMAPVVAVSIGLAMPVLAPESAFARWLDTPFASSVFVAWCFLFGWIAAVVARIRTWTATKRSEATAGAGTRRDRRT